MKNPPMGAAKFHVWLKVAGGCADCRSWSKGKDLRTIWDTCQRGNWLEWLLNACGYQWTAPARAEYERVKADIIRDLIPYPFAPEVTRCS